MDGRACTPTYLRERHIREARLLLQLALRGGLQVLVRVDEPARQRVPALERLPPALDQEQADGGGRLGRVGGKDERVHLYVYGSWDCVCWVEASSFRPIPSLPAKSVHVFPKMISTDRHARARVAVCVGASAVARISAHAGAGADDGRWQSTWGLGWQEEDGGGRAAGSGGGTGGGGGEKSERGALDGPGQEAHAAVST